jgi:hypothetical protein
MGFSSSGSLKIWFLQYIQQACEIYEAPEIVPN